MNKEEKEFIIENLDKDVSSLLFKYHQDTNKRFLINQISKRQKIKSKLPSYYNNFDFIFPTSSKSIEQCSSEISALTKSNFFQGENFIDLTGGLGAIGAPVWNSATESPRKWRSRDCRAWG